MGMMAAVSYKILILALMAMMLISSSLAQESSYVKGIDVSHYQWDAGVIKWEQVSQVYKFAFIKASEGTTLSWQPFESNMDNAHAHMLVGAYHFGRPDSGDRPSDEAKWFVHIAGNYIKPGYLRPVLDIEWDHYTNGIGVESKSPDYLKAWIDEWISTVKSLTGVEPIIYTHHYYVNPYLKDETSLAKYDVWMADTSDTTPDLAGIWSTWAFWQYKIGSVSGIKGKVDLDYFNGDYSGLSNYIIEGNGETSTPSDSTPPKVQAFEVTPLQLPVGKSFAISYIVSDSGGSGLRQVELWRKDEKTDWREIERDSLVTGNGPTSGSFTDSPSVTGNLWYGLHVVDNSNNWNDERNSRTNNQPGIYGPIEVKVIENLPAALSQLKLDGNSISVGAKIADRSVAFKAKVSGTKSRLQVELRRLDEYDGQFDETKGGLKESDKVDSNKEATAYAYGLIDGNYHWRARIIDESGKASKWVDFGNNPASEADFIVYAKTVVPPDKSIDLYLTIHEGCISGQILSGVRVTGHDGTDNRFDKTTNSYGNIVFKGSSGKWHFEPSKKGYQTNVWDQELISSARRDAFLVKITERPPPPAESLTLLLAVHEGSISGQILSGVRVTGHDGINNQFDKTTTSYPYVGFQGSPGIWHFEASKKGYQTNVWDQELISSASRDAFLIKQKQETESNTGTAFNKGDQVRTTSDKKLNVRSGPGTSSQSIGTMVKGSMGTVMDGPIFVDNLNWWKIEYDAGITGWSSGKWLEFAPQTQKGCHKDPVTGQVKCSDDISVFSNEPIAQPLSDGATNNEPVQPQTDCHEDPVTGQTICEDDFSGDSQQQPLVGPAPRPYPAYGY